MQQEDVYHFSDLPTVKDPATKVWRYLTPEKFLALLDERVLYFPNANRFEDPVEGTYPDENRAPRDYLWKTLNVSDEQKEIIEGHSKWNKGLTFVSCWHISDHESDAFWRIYGTEKGVAVQSTVGRLKVCLPSFVHIHKVTYIDYKSEKIPETHSLYPFFFKSREYSSEQELRAVTGDLSMSDPRRRGVNFTDTAWSFPIDPSRLIERVYVAPKYPEREYEMLKSHCQRVHLTAPVLHSSMDREPRY